MDLNDLQKESKIWGDHNFPNQESWKPLLGIGEELGELNHAHLKLVQGIRVGENLREKQLDAVGDIIIYLADYCNREDISLDKCVEYAWEEASKRNWIKFPKNGVSE